MAINLLLITLLSCNFYSAESKLLPDLYWNTSNPLFGEPNPTMDFVEIGDRLNIWCPHYDDTTLAKDTEQAIIFRVSKESYTNCVLGPESRAVGSCQNPFAHSLITIVFREFTPNPIGLEFTHGSSYYFISTSNGKPTGLQNIAGGLCSDKNMRLRISIMPDLTVDDYDGQWEEPTIPDLPKVAEPVQTAAEESDEFADLMEKVMQEKEQNPFDWWAPESAPVDNQPLPAHRARLLPKHNKEYGAYEIVEPKSPQDIANSVFWPLAADEAREKVDQFEEAIITPNKQLYVIEEVVDVGRLRSSSSTLSFSLGSLLLCTCLAVLNRR